MLFIILGLLIGGLSYNHYYVNAEREPSPPSELLDSSELEDVLAQAHKYYYQGEYEKSIKYYEELVGTEKNLEALSNLAVLYEERGQYESAANSYSLLLKEEEKPKYKLGLGISYYNLNRLEKAEESLKEVLSQETKADYIFREANYYLGRIEKNRRNLENAKDYFGQAIGYQPFAPGYYQLGEVSFSEGDYKQARTYYRQALNFDGSLKGVHYKLGLVYLELGNIRAAIQSFQSAHRENSYLAAPGEKLDHLEEEYPEHFPDEPNLPDEGLPPDKNIPEQAIFANIEPIPEAGPEIRIGIMEGQWEVDFRVGSDFLVKEQGEVVAEGKKGELVEAKKSDNGWQLSWGDNNLSFSNPIQIKPKEYEPIEVYNVGHGVGYYWASKEHRQFRGELELKPKSAGLTVINLVQLEEYLLAVVPSEMPASWPKEALKAQAVAARSYTLNNLGKHSRDGYDLCSTVHCAVYRGITREASGASQAIKETSGEVMTYEGRPINAVYSANSGGHTENSEDVWTYEVPYLRGVSTEFEDSKFPLPPADLKEWLREMRESYSYGDGYTNTSHYRWYREVPVDYLEARVGVKNIKEVIPLERGEAGSVKRVLVVGKEEERELTNAIRSRLGEIRSNRFWVQPQYSGGELTGFLFYGSGWGHNVGMDQVAAAGMAQDDWSYTEILHHFYTDVDIED